MAVNRELARYVERHFVDDDQFLHAANIDGDFFRHLIDAHALPGPIYRLWGNGSFWSPIGGQVGIVAEDRPASRWFSPAALWWARRATVLSSARGLSAEQVAAAFRTAFCHDFVEVVRLERNSRYGYPDLFVDGLVDEERAQAMALAEWNDWIAGGYGVCLRRFDAAHLVAKTNESAHIRHLTADGRKEALSAGELMELLDALDRLDAVMLPFAPHQRPFGTPGKWVDAILAQYQLGIIPLVQHWPGLDGQPAGERHCA